ncbi:MAG: hypothetical protein FJY85_23550, partial [Deltaproteobacteria bacterium]|nr:hypothetical protein [Deltaproteobacteria bacterium]
IRTAYNDAKSSGCKEECIRINVVVHSQGAATTHNALALLPAEVLKRLYVTGLGGQHEIPYQGLGLVRNVRNIHDFVPLLSPWNLLWDRTTETFNPITLGFPRGEEDRPISGHTLMDEVTGDQGSYYLYLIQHP